jgi:hypothetical protein
MLLDMHFPFFLLTFFNFLQPAYLCGLPRHALEKLRTATKAEITVFLKFRVLSSARVNCLIRLLKLNSLPNYERGSPLH